MHGDWTAASGYQLGLQLAARPGVDAIFVANDQMAIGLSRALYERGIGVPTDVLVAGFDDIPESAYLTPPLTTVRQNFGAVGQHAVDLLVASLTGDPVAESVVVPAELVVRESSIRPSRGPSPRGWTPA